jgi:hypothetical protein
MKDPNGLSKDPNGQRKDPNGLRRDPKRARKERRSKTRLRCAAGNSDERQPVLRHEGLSRKPPEDETSLELAMLCIQTIAES